MHSAKFSKRRNLENDCRPRGIISKFRDPGHLMSQSGQSASHRDKRFRFWFLRGGRHDQGEASSSGNRGRVQGRNAMRSRCDPSSPPRFHRQDGGGAYGGSSDRARHQSRPKSSRSVSYLHQSPETRAAVATEPIVQNRSRSVLQHPLSVPFRPSLSITATPSSAPVLPPGPPRGSCSYRRAPLRFSTRA